MISSLERRSAAVWSGRSPIDRCATRATAASPSCAPTGPRCSRQRCCARRSRRRSSCLPIGSSASPSSASTAASASCSRSRDASPPPSPGSPSAPPTTSGCCSAARCDCSSRSCSPPVTTPSPATAAGSPSWAIPVAPSRVSSPCSTPDQAAQAEEIVERASGFEEYQRERLRNAIHLRFPDLRQPEEVPLYATPEAIAAKREELKAPARGGDPDQPASHRRGARARRSARELRVQERPAASRVSLGARDHAPSRSGAGASGPAGNDRRPPRCASAPACAWSATVANGR